MKVEIGRDIRSLTGAIGKLSGEIGILAGQVGKMEARVSRHAVHLISAITLTMLGTGSILAALFISLIG